MKRHHAKLCVACGVCGGPHRISRLLWLVEAISLLGTQGY